MNPKFSAYAHPEALVDGAWLQEHLSDPNLRVVESNEDILLHDTGHIPVAVHIDWRGDLQDNTERDYVTPARFAEVCEKTVSLRTLRLCSTAISRTGGRPTRFGRFGF